MDIDGTKAMLLWCAGLNYAVLLAWYAAFLFAHDGLYRLHSRWFTLSPATFDAIHYASMAMYKLGILLLFLVPWVALTLLH